MMKYLRSYQADHDPSQKGVALITALFVLALLSTIAAAVLISAEGEIKMSGIERNSEKALKLAELGVQLARATIEEGAVSGSLASVDGFVDGGYFFTSMGSGMPGNEKWEQWHYDSGISGNNLQSEVTTPLRPVWMKEAPGRNGSWSGNSFYLNNIFGIISGGAYFPIEFATDTEIRAVDEYTGQEGVTYDPNGTFTWEGDSEGDKGVGEDTSGTEGYNSGYAVRMSPMGSYSNMFIPTGQNSPQITRQTIYFTYSGDPDAAADTDDDTSSTVRLRAINSLCNASDTAKVNTLWEFDTEIHGVGTAPAVFDPSPGEPGDEIIYFAVAGLGEANLRSRSSMSNNPNEYDEPDESIYIFAVVDDTSGLDECTKTGSFQLKWAHSFPDPDVAEWTDYPVEEVTATNGMFPPYVKDAADVTPLLPEDDVLVDYRDSLAYDGRLNQVRGNLYMVFDPHSVSPVILKSMYLLDGTNTNGAQMVTAQRKDTIEGVLSDPDDQNSTLVYGDPADPMIEIYLAFAAHSKIKYYEMTTSKSWGRGYGLKKYDNVQARVIALRDRLDGACDSNGENCNWNWDSAKSRFPTMKWMYRLPAWDPKRSDERPWNGYGEFVWETWFEQQVAPMIGVSSINQDGTRWDVVVNGSGEKNGGQRDQYVMVYPAYESLGYTDGSGNYNSLDPPSTANGAPVSFTSSEKWDVSYLMIMGIRDTWDDYMEGYQTNPLWDDMVTDPATDLTPKNAYAMPVRSSPVENYWTHKHDGVVTALNGAMIKDYYPEPHSSEAVVTYSDAERDEWADNADKVGFPRPYIWSEDLWDDNVVGSTVRGLAQQGWYGSGVSTSKESRDLDVEGETSAFCRECLNGDGLIVTVFNHDIGPASSSSSTDIEDLRMHAINATTGKHVWDYHMPATLAGDYFNGTPAIANGMVFVAYSSRNGNNQGAIMQVLDADSGENRQTLVFDDDPNSVSNFDGGTAGRADVLLLPPTIANGAVYVGTYHFRGTTGSDDHDDDSIRIYAFSPVFRMFSMGIYPVSYSNLTTAAPDLTSPTGKGHNAVARAERKIQVWISGTGSKWEEIRESHN